MTEDLKTAPRGVKREVQVKTHLRSGMGTPLWGQDENKHPLARTAVFCEDELAGVVVQRFAEEQGLPDRYAFQRADGSDVDPRKPIPKLDEDEVLTLVKVGR